MSDARIALMIRLEFFGSKTVMVRNLPLRLVWAISVNKDIPCSVLTFSLLKICGLALPILTSVTFLLYLASVESNLASRSLIMAFGSISSTSAAFFFLSALSAQAVLLNCLAMLTGL
ncbi:hypothetical protein OGAPHI_000039 [Ogataea philodendri]|uniref:Uncharacterized protein n=1 Tax=Ogataea philodendri TaxID=1378263 RepID=A0A9P8T9Z0_9ASCO|nr:uncharacterized protein OGAPHI_000039 [Ogataea philodendri]KAH3671853.1 hypothetical protein OGAPHI_000039 [Ogataea philodendri]